MLMILVSHILFTSWIGSPNDTHISSKELQENWSHGWKFKICKILKLSQTCRMPTKKDRFKLKLLIVLR